MMCWWWWVVVMVVQVGAGCQRQVREEVMEGWAGPEVTNEMKLMSARLSHQMKLHE